MSGEVSDVAALRSGVVHIVFSPSKHLGRVREAWPSCTGPGVRRNKKMHDMNESRVTCCTTALQESIESSEISGIKKTLGSRISSHIPIHTMCKPQLPPYPRNHPFRSAASQRVIYSNNRQSIHREWSRYIIQGIPIPLRLKGHSEGLALHGQVVEAAKQP